jgi:two-component system, OmpR family, sensor histidine kinase KdpD
VRPKSRQLLFDVGRTFAGTAGIGAITLGCKLVSVNATTASLLYLLFVLVIATAWGLFQAIFMSVAATLCFNFFFLPPFGTFTIADPQNWIALLAFLITAVIASELSNRVRRQAAVAVDQRRELERLYALSRAVLLDTGEGTLGSTIAHQIADTFGFTSVLLYDFSAHRKFSAGPADLNVSPQELDSVNETIELADGSYATLVRLGNKAAGVLAVRGDIGTAALEAIANLVAITLERAASQEFANQARAARKSEELKSSILDALAHEFKTPLTSIKAASTALLSKAATPAEQQHEFLSIIDEEADRLTNLVTEAIQISHIEAGRIKLTKVPTSMSDIVDSVMTHMKTRLDDRTVQIEIDSGLPQVMVDRDLVELAVRQLLDNALKYSRPGTPVILHATATNELVRLSIRDSGPGIPPHEQQRIFEKFYRGEEIRNKLPGSGVGLTIVKDIVSAHFGTVHVDSSPKNGTIFTLTLPAVAKGNT